MNELSNCEDVRQAGNSGMEKKRPAVGFLSTVMLLQASWSDW